MGETRSEYRLKSPPTDAISTVEFVPKSSTILLVSSWDSYVRIYDVDSNTLRRKIYFNGSPILDLTIAEDDKIYTGTVQGSVVMSSLDSEAQTTIGNHDEAVRCVNYCELKSVLASGSWDGNVKLWDTRSPKMVDSLNQKEQVYSMDVNDEILLVGTAERKIFVWDLRNLNEPLQQRDSLLKYQTRCLRVFPNKQGYVLSSIEGRVAVEYFDLNPEIQKKKYAFKCHRIKEQGIEKIYPVNAVSFHKEHSTFATGGSDGFVNVWDGFNKKRLCQFHRYPTGISSLAFNHNGSRLAIGCSYFDESEEESINATNEDCIFIRFVTDQETKPK